MNQINNQTKNFINFNNKDPIDWNKLTCICCCGDIGAGKTGACFSILDKFNKRKKYIYKHPAPEILGPSGITNIDEINYDQLIDCVIYIDEPQLNLAPQRDKNGFIKFLSLLRQRDVTAILSTSDTRWVSKSLESYVDCWIIKDLDFDSVKQGSTIKRIITDYYNNIMPSHFSLPKEEAIIYSRKFLQKPIKAKVNLPKYWSQDFSKPYKKAHIDIQSEI